MADPTVHQVFQVRRAKERGKQALALHGLRVGGIALVLVLASTGGGTTRAQTADPAGMPEFGGGKLDGLGVSEANDAGLYLDDAIARRRVRLGAYSIEKADRNARLLPGLSGVAKQVQGAQKVHMPLEGKFGYSLADALVDALWRKQVVDSLYRNPDGSLSKDIFE